MMTILVAGASGATGKLLVTQLLDRGHRVKVIVRTPEKFLRAVRADDRLTVIHAGILALSDSEMAQHVRDCDAVASCLGHNPSLKGVFTPPYRLVTEATRRLCSAIKANSPDRRLKFVLMNTAGNRNRDLPEPRSIAERCVIGLVRVLVPPHPDNEQAAECLRTTIGQNDRTIEWVVVRPDTLTNADHVTNYEVHPSPTRSAIFNPGKTSRINVAHFMADLITKEEIWNTWRGRMPVVYNVLPDQ